VGLPPTGVGCFQSFRHFGLILAQKFAINTGVNVGAFLSPEDTWQMIRQTDLNFYLPQATTVVKILFKHPACD
jgi:hypothetical protein